MGLFALKALETKLFISQWDKKKSKFPIKFVELQWWRYDMIIISPWIRHTYNEIYSVGVFVTGDILSKSVDVKRIESRL